MNLYLTSAGFLAAMTTLGHFTVGTRLYLRPTLQAAIDPVAKQIMHCLFHYSSVVLVLAATTLLYLGTQGGGIEGGDLIARFIGLQFALFGIWQLWIALRSDIPNGPVKLFQWTFFLTISGLAFAGSM